VIALTVLHFAHRDFYLKMIYSDIERFIYKGELKSMLCSGLVVTLMREVVLDIVKYYRKSGCYAISNVSVSKLYSWGVFEKPKYLEEHPMQPDIDVLWYDPKEDSLNGVEVKYLRITSKMEETLQPKSYYAGLDEAIALLNFGVDKAWLFRVFDPNVPVNIALNYTKYMKKLAE